MGSRWLLDRRFLGKSKGREREREGVPPSVIQHILPMAQKMPEQHESMLRPVVLSAASAEYIHVATARSAQVLAEVPVEVIDTILSFLAGREWCVLRRTNSMFKSSAQELIYREVEFFDFRPLSVCGSSRTDAFLRILESQPALRDHVRALRLRSLVDPTIQHDIAEFIPRVLEVLGRVRRVTICFSDGTASLKSFMEALVTLKESLCHPELQEIYIESSHPSASMLAKLSHLPITSFQLRKVFESRPPDWHLTMFFDGMKQLTALHRLDLGNLQVVMKWLGNICREFTSITDLSVLVPCHTTNAEASHAMEPANFRLKKLSLRRVPRCHFKGTYGAPIDLRGFIALRTLDLDTSFLIQPAPCVNCISPPTGLIATLDFESPLSNHVPSGITQLTLHFDKPNMVLSRNVLGSPLDPSAAEFECLVGWLAGVLDRLCRVELVEEWHCCDPGIGSRRCAGRLFDVLEYKFCEEKSRILKRGGLDVRIRVYGGGGMVVKAAR